MENKDKKEEDIDFLKEFYKKFKNIEFKNRTFLSRHKFFYAIIGGTGVVLYWRGVWHLTDYLEVQNGLFGILFSPVACIVWGLLLLTFSGLLIQEFIGAEVIISGLKKEKRDIDKTEEELEKEEEQEKVEQKLIREIDSHLHNIESEIKK